jgi:hypothetical protein
MILIGGMAIDRFWEGPARIGRRPLAHEGDGIIYIPLPHPSGASRWLNDPAHRALLTRGLAHVRRAVRALDRQARRSTMPSPRQESAALPFNVARPEVREREEVIIEMPKKKKAAKKKH